MEYKSEAKPKALAGGVPVFCAHDEIIAIEKLIPNPKNPNKHPDEQIQLLGRIIRQTGWRQPITVSTRSGFIVKGHGRLMAAQLEGLTEAPVDYQNYASEAEEYADLTADNRIAELSEIDQKMLADIFADIDTGEIPMELTGYSENEVENLVTALSEALHKEELNSREEYLKAKEDYDLAVKKHALISKRLKKDAQLRRSQMDQMGDNLEAMQKNVQLVRQRKEKLNIRSTISGEIGLLDVELGQSIQAGQKIGVINDLSDFKVQAQVDEHYIDRVKPGLTATFDQNGKHYLLQVRKVYPEVRDGRFRIDFIFKGVRPSNIRTGQTYYVDLQLGQSKQAIIIPKGTFYSVTGGQWIFVLDKSGKKAYHRKITIGRQNPQYYEVIEGLEPGEQVIVSGYEAYKDNEILMLN